MHAKPNGDYSDGEDENVKEKGEPQYSVGSSACPSHRALEDPRSGTK